MVEEAGDRFEDFESDPGVSLEESVDSDEHGGSRGGFR